MAKIKLGNTPKTFKRTIDIINVHGATNQLEIIYKYRTRQQFADLIDEQIDKAEREAEKAKDDLQNGIEPAKKSVAEILAEQDKAGAEAVLKIAEGWDLDDEFTVENLIRLEDENPGSLFSITNVYRAAVSEARTKN